MNGLLEDIACGALGYALGNAERKGSLFNSSKQSSYTDMTLSDYVEKYAQAHGVYTRSNWLADELERLAEKYREF